jgi:hypothetical protein
VQLKSWREIDEELMADNLIRNTWTKLDSHELRLLLHKRIGGPGQFDGREDNPNMFYLPLGCESCRIALKYDNKKMLRSGLDRPSMQKNGRRSLVK